MFGTENDIEGRLKFSNASLEEFHNDLFNELLEEHEIFQIMNELQELIKELIPIMNQNEEMKRMLMEAFITLQNKNITY